jgi:hypothetical protein
MPIHIAWDDADRTILRWDFEQDWDWDELRSAVAATELMITQVPHRVNIIHNALSTPNVPRPTQRHKQHPLDLPSRVGVIVLVGDNPVLSALVTIFMRVFHTLNSRLATASSLEEARLIIAEAPARV